MNPRVKDKLLAALRSGEYKKTTGRLYSKDADGNDCYCALGVLCLVAMENGVPLTFDPNDVGRLQFFSGEEPDSDNGDRTTLLPTVVEKWAGMEDFDAFTIYQVNDSYPSRPFDEVADLLEDRL